MEHTFPGGGADGPPLAQKTPIKILIADDNNSDRILLQALLGKLGHTVISAENGLRAVELFETERPTIVLLDVIMPEMDGFVAAERIKRLAGDEFVPIIFLSGLQETDTLAKCVDAGGDDFLSKPYSAIVLEAKINAFSRMVSMHQTVREQRDKIGLLNQRLLQEQDVAKQVFDKVAHAGCMDLPNIKFALSPIAMFNGDVALAGVGPSGHLLVLLGDFTGHGLSAAIGAMPLAEVFYSMLSKGFGIKDIMREINGKLHEALPLGLFCCALVAEFDFAERVVKVWNGGMPDAVIYHNHEREIQRLPSMHLPLGIRPKGEFNDRVTVHLVEPGDRLYMWSDGIIEAEGEEGEMYGEQRLFAVLEDNRDPDRLFNEINISVNSYIGEGALSDDISLVEVKIVDPGDFQVARDTVTAQLDEGPRDWRLRYELRPDSLKAFDPLPLMLHVLMEVPPLRPVIGQIYTVMAELYSNGLEHGILKLDSALKDSPEGFSEYYRLRKKRLVDLREGYLTITLNYTSSVGQRELVIEIEDSGEGFDFRALQARCEKDKTITEDQQAYAGRGLHLLQSICDVIEFTEPGNLARAVFRW